MAIEGHSLRPTDRKFASFCAKLASGCGRLAAISGTPEWRTSPCAAGPAPHCARLGDPMQERVPQESPPERPRTFAALEVPAFRVMWAGTWASYIPFFMAFAVNSVVAFRIAGRNGAVGTVLFAQGVAMLFLAPLGGAGADRWPKRRVLALSQSAAAAVFGSYALLLWLDRLTVEAMAVGSFVLGVSVSFLGPARQAFAAELVRPELRGNAVALNQVPLTGS